MSIPCDDCEPFTYVYDFDDNQVATSVFTAQRMCSHECTYTLTPLRDAIYYFVTYRYNQPVFAGGVSFPIPGGVLPPPSACFIEAHEACTEVQCSAG